MRTTIQPALKKTLGFLPLFQGPAYGIGFLTAGIVLAIMIVPFVLSVSREVLLAVPRDQREAALALGATKWESTWKVVVPAARIGIFGSVFLALARALGETMAVTMVVGNNPKIAASLFSPGYSIAAVLANEFSEATGNLYLSALIELGPGAVSADVCAEWPCAAPDSGHHGAGQRGAADMSVRLMWRKSLNVVMLSLTGLCALITVSALFFILGYLVWNGGKDLSWNFFTQLPAPVGESRRRNGQCHPGQPEAVAAGGAVRCSHRIARRRISGGIRRTDQSRFWCGTRRTC